MIIAFGMLSPDVHALRPPARSSDQVPFRIWDPSSSHRLQGRIVHSTGVRVLTWRELLAAGEPARELPRVGPADPVVIMLTSGTTGRSKGVVYPNRMQVVAGRERAAQMGTTADERLDTCLPLFHGAAQVNITMHGLHAGATVVLGRRFSASRFWDELRVHRVTRFNALGSILSALLAQPPSGRDRDHQVKRVFAAPAPPQVRHPFQERFGVHIVEGYGLTEIKNVLYNPLDARKVGSIGLPTESSIVEVHDESGRPAAPGQAGEIVYRPRRPHIMFSGYHRDPEATLATICDLWWHTGDLGLTDEDGYFYFIDRKKDALRRRGENISSHEVESVLLAYPGVVAAAAVATPSELGEDEVLAVLQLESGRQVDFADLFAHCDRSMPHFMVPRYYRLVDQLPVTPTGKCARPICAARAGARPGTHTSPDSSRPAMPEGGAMTGQVRIREIAARLTFQDHVVPTEVKVELVRRLLDAGIRAFELSSFVRPDLVPGLADAEEVFAKVPRVPGLSLASCVGNTRGLARAVDAGADAASFLLSADEDFAQANIGRSTADCLAELERMAAYAADRDIVLGTYVIFAWGGPTGPARGPEDLEPLARRLLDIGVDHWTLADSSGYAAPPQIRELVTAALAHVPAENLTVQIHDARGMGLAALLPLLDLGVRNIDTALAGSGGHPAMPGTQGGGVCTEDAVQLLELSGVHTGIDLPCLVGTANWLATEVGAPCKGFVRRTGPVPQAGQTARPLAFSWSDEERHR